MSITNVPSGVRKSTTKRYSQVEGIKQLKTLVELPHRYTNRNKPQSRHCVLGHQCLELEYRSSVGADFEAEEGAAGAGERL